MTLNIIRNRTAAVRTATAMSFAILFLAFFPQTLFGQGVWTDIGNYNHGFTYSSATGSVNDTLFFDTWLESAANPVDGLIAADLDLDFTDDLPTQASISISLSGSCLGSPSELNAVGSVTNPNLVEAEVARDDGNGQNAGGHLLSIAVIVPSGSFPLGSPQVRLGGVIMVENIDLKWSGDKFSEPAKAKIWPQPASTTANIAWGDKSTASIQVFDLQGRVLFQTSGPVSLPYVLPVTSMPTGQYWIRLSDTVEHLSQSLFVKPNP